MAIDLLADEDQQSGPIDLLAHEGPIAPKQPEQTFGTKLPINVKAGLANAFTGLANIPYELGKVVSTTNFGRLLGGKFYPSPEEVQQRQKTAEMIPHFGEHDFGKELGLTGQPTLSDKAIQLGTEFAVPLGYGIKGLKTAIKAIPAITTKGISKEVLAANDLAKQKYGKLYNKLFQEAETKGIKNLEKPKINFSLIEKNSLPKYHTALKEFKINPTVENAHKAQSDLGKLQRAMEKSNTVNPLTSSQHKTYREIVDAKNKIKESMFKGHPELSERYNKITHGYKSDVIPYSTNKALNLYKNGELTEKKLLQRLKNNDAFMLSVGKEHPGIKINQALKSKIAKKAIGSVLTGVGFKKGWDITH
jgi:arsenate reductase-like glutaredoxin family protein